MKTTSPGRRAAAYWFLDGLPDILFGTTLLFSGALGLALCIFVRPSYAWPDFLVICAGVLLFSWKGRAFLEFLKSRVTYPRTGYVRPPQDYPDRPLDTEDQIWFGPEPPITLSVNGPPPDENVIHFNARTLWVVFWWCYISLALHPWMPWFPPLLMPALAAALYLCNRRSERPYRWWPVLILALCGPALMLLKAGPRLEPLLLPMLAGAWLVADGASAFARYLRSNPSPQAAEGVRA